MAEARLRAVRATYRARGERRAGDLGYAVYVAGFVALVAAAPAARALLLALTAPDALRALHAPQAASVTGVVAGAALAALAILGTVRGPAHYPAFVAFLVTETDLPRHLVLRRPFAVSTAVLAAGAALVSAVPVVALALGGQIAWAECLPPIAGAGAFGVVAAVVWAAGQRLGRGRAWMLSAGIAAAVGVTGVAPALLPATPWGWLALLHPTADRTESGWPLAALCVAAVAALVASRWLLAGMPGRELVQQAQRWESAASAATSGDPALALSTFRALPAVGRAWNAVATRAPLAAVFWRRDLVGAARTPVRFAGATLGLLAAGAATAAAASLPETGWVLGAAAALLAFAALGALGDGLRHAAEAFGAPQLYGLSRVSLVAHHAAFPLSAGLAIMLVGAGVAVALGSPATGLGLAASVAATVLLARVFDGAKGPLPPVLLAPIPTPVGDMSGAVVLVWQVDAVLLVAIAGAAVLAAFEGGGAPAAVVVAAGAATSILLLAVFRYRRL